MFPALGLNESEILTLALSADIDGTSRIDYQEFMKYFKNSLFWVKFNNELQQMYDEECAYAGLVAGSKTNTLSAQGASPQVMWTHSFRDTPSNELSWTHTIRGTAHDQLQPILGTLKI